ncbi:MAG: hypothetical protein IKR11_10645, partial [Solobacterium sp.]|nr:hypothetical protein [Solobacterium sp.]
MKKKWMSVFLTTTLLAGNTYMIHALAEGNEPPEPPSGGMPSGGSSSFSNEWTSVITYDSDTEENSGTYDSTGTDEN